MTMRFEHVSLAQRVVFDAYEAVDRVIDEVERLGGSRVMLIAGERYDRRLTPWPGSVPVAVRQTEVTMHVPVELAEQARSTAREAGVDVLICIGGGSAVGLAKAIALTSGLPIIAVPTTYAGSEVTPVWGLTEDGRKTTGVDGRVLPRAIVYDASLTLSLSVETSAASGLNAIAHCIDSLWAASPTRSIRPWPSRASGCSPRRCRRWWRLRRA